MVELFFPVPVTHGKSINKFLAVNLKNQLAVAKKLVCPCFLSPNVCILYKKKKRDISITRKHKLSFGILKLVTIPIRTDYSWSKLVTGKKKRRSQLAKFVVPS